MPKSKVQPIALDLGHDSVKLLQIEVVGGRLVARAAARQQVAPLLRGEAARGKMSPPGDPMAAGLDVLKFLIRQQGFVGRQVIACLPREIVHTKNLRLPIMPAADLAAAVRFEARNVFPFDTDDATVEFLPAGEVRQGADVRQEVIVFAALNSEIDTFVARLHRAGVVPVSLDIEPLAIYRTVERFVRRREDEQEVAVLVEVGARRSQVVIGRGREISFFKAVDIGGDKLHEAVSRKLGITTEEAKALRRRLACAVAAASPPDSTARSGAGSLPGFAGHSAGGSAMGSSVGSAGLASWTGAAGSTADSAPERDPVRRAVLDATRLVMEELARELSLCLRYYSVTFRGHRPTVVKLLGGEGSDPQLRAILNASLPVPVVAGTPMISVDCRAMKECDRQGTMSEWAAALGLSLRLTSERFLPRDGKPRSAYGKSAGAEIVDLNTLIPPASSNAPRELSPAQTRASASEAANA